MSEEASQAAATPQTGQPQAAEAQTQLQAGEDFQALVAQLGGDPGAEPAAEPSATPQAGAQLPAQPAAEPPKTLDTPPAAAQTEPEKKFLDAPEPPKPQSLRERLIQQEAQRKAQSEIDQLRSELTQKLDLERQQRESATYNIQQAKKLYAEGDFDGAVKLLELGNNFQEVQKRYLEQKGAIPKEDPRVTELQTKLQEFEKREAERREAEEQQRQQWAAQQEYQQELQTIREEMKSSGYVDVQAMAELPGAVDMVRNLMRQDLQQGIEPSEMTSYWSKVKSNYVQLQQALNKALPPDPGVTQATPPAQPGVSAAASATQPIASQLPGQPGASVERAGATAPTTLSQEQSSDVVNGPGRFEDDDQFFSALVKQAGDLYKIQ